jgi:hypothetical protein
MKGYLSASWWGVGLLPTAVCINLQPAMATSQMRMAAHCRGLA